MRAIYGEKKLITRIFDKDGRQVPVTVVKVEKNVVTQVKTQENDGYKAVQVGSGNKRHINKAEEGHSLKAKIKPRILYEIKSQKEFKVGDEISLDDFNEKEKVSVTGISKGKGFAGTVKRHNFNTGPKTHGSNNYRQPGSIGDTGPQRVVKGKRMAGHMGARKVTTKNVQIYRIEKDSGRIYLKGPVPGPLNSGIIIWSKNEN